VHFLGGLLKSGFLPTYLDGNCPPVPSPFSPSPAKATSLHLSQIYVEQRIEVTFDCRLAKITDPAVQNCPSPVKSDEKALLEITIYIIIKVILILILLSFDP